MENSRELIDRRISLNLFILKILPYFSSLIFIIGVLLTGFGIKRWANKQLIVDRTERLNLVELEEKIKKLKPSEIQEKAKKEIEEEFSFDDIEKSKNEKIPDSKEKIINGERLSANLLDMEDLFFQKIINYNSFNYNANSNVKIDDKFEIDILLRSYNNKNPDILIEIKYLQNKLSMQFIKNNYSQILQTRNRYITSLKREAKAILIVVFNKGIAQEDEINRFFKAIEDYKELVNKRGFELLLLNDEEVKNFDVRQIID